MIMNNLTLIVLIFMGAAALISLIVNIPFANIYYYFKSKNEKSNNKCLNSFFNDDNPGSSFVQLVCIGRLQTIKTGNHGNDFPDAANLKTFNKYSNRDIKNALDNIEAEIL